MHRDSFFIVVTFLLKQELNDSIFLHTAVGRKTLRDQKRGKELLFFYSTTPFLITKSVPEPFHSGMYTSLPKDRPLTSLLNVADG